MSGQDTTIMRDFTPSPHAGEAASTRGKTMDRARRGGTPAPQAREAAVTTENRAIAYCKIHPAIGIARVGNSPDEFFIGPEIPGGFDPPSGGYKDAGDLNKGIPPRIKRQAARFRIFAYNTAGQVVQ